MTALMGSNVQDQDFDDTVELELALEAESQPGGDVIVARWLAVFFTVTGLAALLVSRGQWGLAGLLAAAVALLYAHAAAWADRREASQHLSR